MATYGQKAFIDLGGTAEQIAIPLGIDRRQVNEWRHGTAIPSGEMRDWIRDVYGIPPADWDRQLPDRVSLPPVPKARRGRPPKASAGKPAPVMYEPPRPSPAPAPHPMYRAVSPAHAPPPPSVPPAPPPPPRERPTLPKGATALQELRYYNDCIAFDLEAEGLTVAAKSRLRTDARNNIVAIRRIEREIELTEDRFVREHPAFKKLTAKLLDALRPFPEASNAVVEALK